MPPYDPHETARGHLNNALMICRELLVLDADTLTALEREGRDVATWAHDVASVRDRIVAALDAMERESH